jgi:hypothetical protein
MDNIHALSLWTQLTILVQDTDRISVNVGSAAHYALTYFTTTKRQLVTW